MFQENQEIQVIQVIQVNQVNHVIQVNKVFLVIQSSCSHFIMDWELGFSWLHLVFPGWVGGGGWMCGGVVSWVIDLMIAHNEPINCHRSVRCNLVAVFIQSLSQRRSSIYVTLIVSEKASFNLQTQVLLFITGVVSILLSQLLVNYSFKFLSFSLSIEC